MNHKDYLLGLLDGSHTLSHEGIGMVIERMEKLETALKAAEEMSESWEIGQDSRDARWKFKSAVAAIKEMEQKDPRSL